MSTRGHVLRGPARVEYAGVVLHSLGEVRLTLRLRTRHAGAVATGPLEYWVDEVELTVAFQPAAAWSAPVLNALFPYGGVPPGHSLFAGGDRPLVIHASDGVKLTLHAAALTRMPTLRLGGHQPMFGEAHFRALPAAGGTRAAEGALYKIEQAAPPSPGERGRLFASPVRASWGGSAPWNTLSTTEGIEIECSMRLREETSDEGGVADLTVLEVAAVARFTPAGAAETALLAAARAQGPGAHRGASLYPASADLVLAGAPGGPLVTLRRAALVDEAGVSWAWHSRVWDALRSPRSARWARPGQNRFLPLAWRLEAVPKPYD